MRKNLIYLFVFLLLCLAAWLILRRGSSTLKGELKDFAIEDTASIDRIILADKEGKKVTLERISSNRWKVNGSFEANQGKINTLLGTMKNVQVKSPVPAKDLQSVIIDMATRHTLVKIFQKGQLIKTYFVGIQTVDQLGTYMLMEHSKVPFIMHIPGFNGYLNGRYFTSARDWKTRRVFDWPPQQIDYVKVEYPGDPAASFVLSNENGRPAIVPLAAEDKSAGVPDSQMMKYYLSAFHNIMYEGYDQANDPKKADSVSRIQPYCIMELRTKDGQKSRIRIHFKGVDERTMQQFNEKTLERLKVDPERYLAFLNDEKELIVIQDYVFANLFRKYQDFFKKAG
jgi:hypothetical protein